MNSDQDAQPTTSHALASQGFAKLDTQVTNDDTFADYDQNAYRKEWRNDDAPIRQYLNGIEKDDFWTLIRRFNKQVGHVKRIENRPSSGLDMDIAPQADIAGDRLRAQAERLYTTVIMRLFVAYKHIVRLRSWRERTRTFSFLAAFSLAWLADLLLAALFLFLIILIVYPSSRDICFPPAPPSLTDGETGGIQKPPAGVLASDSFTGAPEKQTGEAVEQEARNFLNMIGTLLMSITSGEYSQERGDRGPKGPKQMAQDISNACDIIGEQKIDHHDDRTKAPVSRTIDQFPTRVALHALPDFIDTWERLENALSPKPPFYSTRPRLVLAGCFVIPMVLSVSISSHTMNKLLGFGIGFWIFGKPLIDGAVSLIDRQFPSCHDHFELRNSVLRGVPTNVQLTAAMLRIGERNNAPLPPPPREEEPPEARASLEALDLSHLGASTEDIQTAISPVSSVEYAEQEKMEPGDAHDEERRSTTQRIADRLKKTTKSGVKTVHKIAELKNSSSSSVHINQGQDFGSFKAPARSDEPFRFPSRYSGKKGNAYIMTTAKTAAVSWMGENENLGLAWTVATADMQEVKKVGGLGWKRKAFIDWALDREVSEGLVLKTKAGGEFCLTAVSSRDEMFNRLVTMGDQKWAVW